MKIGCKISKEPSYWIFVMLLNVEHVISHVIGCCATVSRGKSPKNPKFQKATRAPSGCFLHGPALDLTLLLAKQTFSVGLMLAQTSSIGLMLAQTSSVGLTLGQCWLADIKCWPDAGPIPANKHLVLA